MNSNRGRVAFGLAAFAVVWALLLVASAFFVPAYSGETCGTGGCTSTSSTLFAENGWLPIALLAGIVTIAAVAFYALHVVCSRGSDRAAKLATWCALVVMAFALVGAASVGLFVLPVALLLGASAMLTPQRRAPRAPRGS
jgi:hypothetical protein